MHISAGLDVSLQCSTCIVHLVQDAVYVADHVVDGIACNCPYARMLPFGATRQLVVSCCDTLKLYGYLVWFAACNRFAARLRLLGARFRPPEDFLFPLCSFR